MSSTNRGGVRRKNDLYETPSWCVERLLEALPLPGGNWLEPGAGSGNIIRTVNSHRSDVCWTAVEKYPLELERLQTAVGAPDRVIAHNFLECIFTSRYKVILGNPPYKLAKPFIVKSLDIADHVVMLLRVNFLASEKRQDFFRQDQPDVYVLPNRPSFTDGGTDSTEYAWFHWTQQRHQVGSIRVLNLTPKEVRKKIKDSRELLP